MVLFPELDYTGEYLKEKYKKHVKLTIAKYVEIFWPWKKQVTDLLSSEYDKILGKVYEIQEALEHHNKIFDEKVCQSLCA